MAITGNLAECRPAHIMRVIVDGRKTGRLTVQGSQQTAECYFRDGRLDVVRSPESRPLVEALSSAGLLNAEQAASLRPHGAQSDREVLDRLREFGYVEPPRVLATLRKSSSDAVQAILRWDRGTFRLDESVAPPAESLPLSLDLTSLVSTGPVAPTTAVASSGESEAPRAVTPSPNRPRRWWDWLRGGKDDRRH